MAIVDRTNNISVMYIRNFLGMYEGLNEECLDVGTLCTKCTQKWAKYKPVRFPQMDTSSYPNWYRAYDGLCGLDIKTYTTMSAMFTALRAGINGWDYIKPNGGDSSPYRLLDYVNHDSNAQSPFIPLNLADTYYASLGTMGVALDLHTPSEYELTLADLGNAWNLSEMYFGVAICKQGTSGYKYMTQNITMSAGGGGGIDVPISSELGTYEVVYFLAEKSKLSFSDPDKTNTFIPIPNAMQIVYIEDSPISVYVLGTFAMMTANYEITIQNNQANTLTLTGCNIAFRYGNKLPSDALVVGEKNKSLGTVTVQGNSSVTLTGVITAVGADYDTLGGYLWFSNATNSTYNTRGEFEFEA